MTEPSFIRPRSPREVMCGWVHLPRFVDKLRLHLAGRLHPDYHDNLTRGFDGRWLATAGVDAAGFTEVVRRSITDGEVAEWVREHVRVDEATKQAFNAALRHYPPAEDGAAQDRLRLRKQQCGLADRDDIRCMFDVIDADEGRP
ncbi:MAG: DUF5069 domain-containing protein [Verrucomicrobiales bacterium]|nr:DUF5069 domain-containing protein [Verrucomicrobiales bacterium]MCP5526822.1 DUF5069 domain-containing protein [Verrucomicrobiales bacterium]